MRLYNFAVFNLKKNQFKIFRSALQKILSDLQVMNNSIKKSSNHSLIRWKALRVIETDCETEVY